jgi:hypothetical protein
MKNGREFTRPCWPCNRVVAFSPRDDLAREVRLAREVDLAGEVGLAG